MTVIQIEAGNNGLIRSPAHECIQITISIYIAPRNRSLTDNWQVLRYKIEGEGLSHRLGLDRRNYGRTSDQRTKEWSYQPLGQS